MAEANFYNSNENIASDKPNISRKRSHESEGTETPPRKILHKSSNDSQEGIGLIVANHYNSNADLGFSERNKSRIFYMRNFNNWVKSYFITKFLDLIREHTADEHKIAALDLACGKGGDLFKWQKGQIRHLICADIAEDCIAQCRERHENSRQKSFTAEFIVADCTKSSLKLQMKNPDIKFDIVSCQFALHYSFESLPQAEMMVRNAADLLRKGGYFIASLPDAYKIMSLIETSEDKRTYKNEVFRIEFPENRPQNPKLFGDKYNFFLEGVVNCPEFLVHYPTLVRICRKYGLEVISRKSFEEMYVEGIRDRDLKNLLFRMQALETYSSFDDRNLSSSSESEYSHAQKLIDDKGMKSVKTISKSEWEAICIYMAVAFKKVK